MPFLQNYTILFIPNLETNYRKILDTNRELTDLMWVGVQMSVVFILIISWITIVDTARVVTDTGDGNTIWIA